jgi:hypothetical protein
MLPVPYNGLPVTFHGIQQLPSPTGPRNRGKELRHETCLVYSNDPIIARNPSLGNAP